jgi:hypothetical protein
VPANALVEVTTRTIQGRLLLKPSPELTEIILGVIGKAQCLYGMAIHAFVLVSTHAHFLLSPSSAGQLAKFMQFVNANIAKEAGRLHLWRDRLWSRRYRSIVVADEKAAHARLRYILAHGAKEGLVGKSAEWPGPNCIAALTTGELLRGTWFDRSAEYIARQRGESVLPSQFATTFDVKLTPLPCLLHLTEDQRQAECRRIVKEIQAAAEAENKAKGREPMGVTAILAQDPHSRPATTDRSPAPFVHASDEKTELEFRAQYRAFVDAFRTDQRPREGHARRLSPTKDSRLPRPRSPSCPTQRRRFPLGIAVLAVVHASHHPLQRRSRGMSTDVQGRLQENLQENSGTTPPACPPTFKGDSRKTSKKTQAPHHREGHVHRRSRETPGKPPRRLRHHTTGRRHRRAAGPRHCRLACLLQSENRTPAARATISSTYVTPACTCSLSGLT